MEKSNQGSRKKYKLYLEPGCTYKTCEIPSNTKRRRLLQSKEILKELPSTQSRKNNKELQKEPHYEINDLDEDQSVDGFNGKPFEGPGHDLNEEEFNSKDDNDFDCNLEENNAEREEFHFDNDMSEQSDSDNSVDHNCEDDSEESNPETPDFNSDFQDDFGVGFSKKLLTGASPSKSEAILLIQAFSLRHNLSELAIHDLLCLINTLFGSEVVPVSKYHFKKCFRKPFSHKNYMCEECNEILNSKLQCKSCSKSYDVDHIQKAFFTIPLKTQLIHLLENEKNCQKIGYRFSREKKNLSGIEDIYDGAIYKQLSQVGEPLYNPSNLSITFCTDGAAVFQNSKYTMWPLFVIINELPPKERMANILLVGLWCGIGDPVMDIFLQPFVKELEDLNTSGFQWRNSANAIVKSKVITICTCPDSVARPLLQNSKQYNGRFGCSWCLHPLHSVNTSGKSKQKTCLRYTENENVYDSRNEHDTIRDMELAFKTGEAVNGMKGPTPLMNLPYFNIVDGFVPDYLHIVLLGVVKTITEKWLTLNGEIFYIESPKLFESIDCRLVNIKPPMEIVRRPRSLKDRHIWKANEWRNWLLFYAFPCLSGILGKKYLKHFLLLGEGIFLLLKSSILPEELNRSHHMMCKFVYQYEIYYGKHSMVANVHFLLHITNSVYNFGPLWAHSTFVFESGNGNLVNFVKGTQGIPVQVCHKYISKQCFDSLVIKYYPQMEMSVRSLVQKLTGYQSYMNNENNKAFTSIPMGKPELRKLSESEINYLKSSSDLPIAFDEMSYHKIFQRVKYNDIILHSTKYTRAKKQINYFVCVSSNSINYYGEILNFVYLNLGCQNSELPIVILREYKVVNIGSNGHPYLRIVKKTQNILVFKLSSIKEKCVMITVNKKHYISPFPNLVESKGIM